MTPWSRDIVQREFAVDSRWTTFTSDCVRAGLFQTMLGRGLWYHAYILWAAGWSVFGAMTGVTPRSLLHFLYATCQSKRRYGLPFRFNF